MGITIIALLQIVFVIGVYGYGFMELIIGNKFEGVVLLVLINIYIEIATKEFQK